MVEAKTKADIESIPRVIGLGGGVQSTCMALMAERGDFGPKPVAALWPSTGAETQDLRDWLDRLQSLLSFHIIDCGRHRLARLATTVRKSKSTGVEYIDTRVPLWTSRAPLAPHISRRDCAPDEKIQCIHTGLTRIRIAHGARRINWMIPIARDEAHRMRPSSKMRVITTWPLIDAGLSVADCKRVLAKMGISKTPDPSCYMCAFRSNADWHRLRRDCPAEFAAAEKFEEDVQRSSRQINAKLPPWLSRSCVSISALNSHDPDGREEEDGFGNDCMGVCGV